jgi:hypothetical protein
MMWDRVFGRPKETVEHQTEESEAERALRALSPDDGSSSGRPGATAAHAQWQTRAEQV